jgi:hypothetical protein
VTLAPLSPDEVARANADIHAGYELISYGEIGLPYFELKLRAQVLERKVIDPFAEYVSRAVDAGIDDVSEVQSLLGLDSRVLEATVIDLVVKEQLSLGDGGTPVLELTARGRQVLADAATIQPVASALTVNFDGLVQEVLPPFGDYLHPRHLKEHGIREIPLPSRLRPELETLDIREIEAVIRQIGGGREQLRDILAIKSMRRYRVFRPAMALLFRSDTSEDTIVDIALEGQVSQRHSLAFAEAGLPRKLGIVGTPERAEDQLAPIVGQKVAAILHDKDRNQKMRELKRAIRAAAPVAAVSEVHMEESEEPTPVPSEAVRSRGDRAQEILDQTKVKAIDTFEHPEYLVDAMTKSRQRVIIVSPWLRGDVMDNAFMGRLENLLQRGVNVHLGWGISKDEREEPNADRRVLKRLGELAARYRNLDVRRLGNTHAKVLLSDDRYVIVTSFNWLSFRGDPKRTFRDERGTMISNAGYVEDQAAKWLARFGES